MHHLPSPLCNQYHMISLTSWKYLHATQWDPEDSTPSPLKHGERQEAESIGAQRATQTHCSPLLGELQLYASQDTHSPTLLFTLTALCLLKIRTLEWHSPPSCHPKTRPTLFTLQDDSNCWDLMELLCWSNSCLNRA